MTGGKELDQIVDEVMKYIEEEDAKFIRLAFRDAYGTQKNISVMPGEMKKAFEEGIPVNARAICGFESSPETLLYLKPDASTLTVLPWRPDTGRVLRMFCDVVTKEGVSCAADTREVLKQALKAAEREKLEFRFGSKAEFYLLKKDDEGNPTKIPYDRAGYMDIAPLDRCENVRREISLTIEKMGLIPERSHHERGPGQNEIDFHYAKPLKAADQLTTFKMVVNTVADRNGLVADFSPEPISGEPGNAYQIDIYVASTDQSRDQEELAGQAAAGICAKIAEIMNYLRPSAKAKEEAFGTICVRNQVQRTRAELRIPGALSNPYLVYALLIHAGIYGIREKLVWEADAEKGREVRFPLAAKKESAFAEEFLPEGIVDSYRNHGFDR